MNDRINLSGTPANPLLKGLMIAGGLLAFAALVLFSLIAFLVIASIIIVLAGVLGLRLWWQARKLSRRTDDPQGRAASGNVIEGEYRRVPPRRDRED